MRIRVLDRIKYAFFTVVTVLFGTLHDQTNKGDFVAREFRWHDHVRTLYLVRGVEKPVGTMEPRQ